MKKAKKKETMKEIAARLGISRQALHARLRRKMDRKKALSVGPLATNPNPVRTLIARAEGRETITQMCLEAGVSESTYYTRRARGLSHEECLKATSVKAESA